jgi:hypothetical protein
LKCIVKVHKAASELLNPSTASSSSRVLKVAQCVSLMESVMC